MRIIKNGKVYDLSYGSYNTVTRLPSSWQGNAVGNAVETTREIRQDVKSGCFYIAATTGGYDRADVRIVPVSADTAASMAEDHLDYDNYVKFFGDPEGVDKGLERERDSALKAKNDAESAKDFWYGEYRKERDEADGLRKRIAELEKGKEAEDGENH